MTENIYTYRGLFYGYPPETYRIIDNKATSQYPQVAISTQGDEHQFSRSEHLYLMLNENTLLLCGYFIEDEMFARSTAAFAGFIPKKIKIINNFTNEKTVGFAYIQHKSYLRKIKDTLLKLSQKTNLPIISMLRLITLFLINQLKYVQRFGNTRFNRYLNIITMSVVSILDLLYSALKDFSFQLKYSLLVWPSMVDLKFTINNKLKNLIIKRGINIGNNKSGYWFYGLIQPNSLCKPVYLQIMSSLRARPSMK